MDWPARAMAGCGLLLGIKLLSHAGWMPTRRTSKIVVANLGNEHERVAERSASEFGLVASSLRLCHRQAARSGIYGSVGSH